MLIFHPPYSALLTLQFVFSRSFSFAPPLVRFCIHGRHRLQQHYNKETLRLASIQNANFSFELYKGAISQPQSTRTCIDILKTAWNE